jgi:phosphomevalonate kinase
VITADAPGKLVLLGEYAVLAGAPGIAVSVDVRARARITPAPAGESALVIPDTGARHPFRWISGGPPRWEGASPGAFGLPLEAVSEILYARGHLRRAGDLPATVIELGTADFHHTDARGRRHKLGLGSSAAVIVALTGALLRHGGGAAADQAELLAITCEAHRRLQGGAGSGTDVATALYGGVVGVEFAAPGAVPRVTPLAWPRGLHCLAIWTGRSASTPAMLTRLRGFQQAEPAAAAGHFARLGAAAARGLAAFRAGDVPAVLDAVGHFGAGLRMLDTAVGLGIWSAEHEQLAALAAAAGVPYKPSGAGGGDYGVALADRRALLAPLRAAVEAAGFSCLEPSLAVPGLMVHGAAADRRPLPGRAPA